MEIQTIQFTKMSAVSDDNNIKKSVLKNPPITAEIQTWLVSYLAELLEIKPDEVGVTISFDRYGLDSSAALSLTSDLEDWLGSELDPDITYDYPTIEALAEYIASDKKVKKASSHNQKFELDAIQKTVDLKAEAFLDPTIYPAEKSNLLLTEPASIFLTGATGFLGAFLLYELLQQTQAEIYCLIRAADTKSGKKRIQNNLECYNLWNQHFQERIIPIVGDLSQPKLGLVSEQFHKMACQIDTIYHSAALLNYVYPYERFKPINVLGTQEVLRLASQIKVKPVHYISSVAVFESSSYCQKLLTESDRLAHTEGMYLGYSQSKWVAEKLVMMARERGIPVCIYRAPFISGHSQTGVWNTDDIICRMIKGCIQMGSIADLDTLLDLSPVDYVSQAIIYLSRQKDSIGKAFHLNNPQPIHWRNFGDLIRSWGYSMDRVPYESWQAQLDKNGRSQENPLYPLLPFFLKKWSEEQLTITELYQQSRRPQINCQKTLDALERTNIVCSPVKAELLNTYFLYFIRSGFLEPAAAYIKAK